MTKRLAIILTSVMAALVIAAVVIVVVVTNNLSADVKESNYRQCVTAGGVYEASVYDKAVIAGRCYDSIYG
ncbi:hypothetical protein RWH45_10595 [Microbacterium sp. KSW4-17]|uniref:Uncharacterized protein n=1 Tax=Microbacterium galbum TaxID=3075994 RepID=A0ABU3T8G7_9MICO|nr:hypothetical protein [Microbacterium sp. KSW4-17]MDU0367666.1 hypothetical protein [Microbacterium sp. KSW4-17]